MLKRYYLGNYLPNLALLETGNSPPYQYSWSNRGDRQIGVNNNKSINRVVITSIVFPTDMVVFFTNYTDICIFTRLPVT